MSMEKKITKRERFMQLREIVRDNEELVAFIDHELELLNNKSKSGGQTKTQQENVKVAEMLIEELAKTTEPTTITDLMNNSEVIKNYTYIEGKETKRLSNQKISAIFKQLVDGGKLVKTTNKKKSYFSVAD